MIFPEALLRCRLTVVSATWIPVAGVCWVWWPLRMWMIPKLMQRLHGHIHYSRKQERIKAKQEPLPGTGGETSR